MTGIYIKILLQLKSVDQKFIFSHPAMSCQMRFFLTMRVHHYLNIIGEKLNMRSYALQSYSQKKKKRKYNVIRQETTKKDHIYPLFSFPFFLIH